MAIKFYIHQSNYSEFFFGEMFYLVQTTQTSSRSPPYSLHGIPPHLTSVKKS